MTQGWRTGAAWTLLAAQIALAAVVPVVLYARSEATATTAAIDEKDCCAGTHPGQACPMRHPRPRAAASVAEGLCRLTCADPDPYASWLAGLLAWEPSSSAWVFPDDAFRSGASPLFSAIAELAGPPLSPPPRA